MALRRLTKARAESPIVAAAAEKTQRELDRPTADQIYEQVSRNARHELDRAPLGLAISGLAGGITMGLTALSTSIVVAELGPGASGQLCGPLFLPYRVYRRDTRAGSAFYREHALPGGADAGGAAPRVEDVAAVGDRAMQQCDRRISLCASRRAHRRFAASSSSPPCRKWGPKPPI